MNISTASSLAAEILAEAGIAEARREASSLMAFVLEKDAAFLIAHADDALAANQKMLFESCVRRRAAHEPFQYIVGHQEFYGLDFDVTPDVLIPRPETEILVECAIDILSGLDDQRFLEIGVGSGCITVSILNAVDSATAVGIDISEMALAVARGNAEKHRVDQRLKLQQADVFEGLSGTFDMIVSNPPYVPRDHLDSLQAEVRDFEPHAALDGGRDGLAIIEQIISESPEFLGSDGILLVEIGFDQAAKVGEFFESNIWHQPEFLADLQGVPRIAMARKNSGNHEL